MALKDLDRKDSFSFRFSEILSLENQYRIPKIYNPIQIKNKKILKGASSMAEETKTSKSPKNTMASYPMCLFAFSKYNKSANKWIKQNGYSTRGVMIQNCR